jgi:hypothetical protein
MTKNIECIGARKKARETFSFVADPGGSNENFDS